MPARFVEAVEVDERFNGEVVWQGAVKVFDVTGHPSGATRAYAWSYRTEGALRRFKAVLGVPPVVDARTVVQAAIVAEHKALSAAALTAYSGRVGARPGGTRRKGSAGGIDDAVAVDARMRAADGVRDVQQRSRLRGLRRVRG